MAVTAAAHAFALLLALAGLSKLMRPTGVRQALRLAHLPDGLWLVRALAVGELGVAAAVLVAGGPAPAGAMAVTYAAFAVFSLRQRARAGGCGCFGDEGAPAGWTHVVVDAVGAAAGVGAALAGAPALVDLLRGQPLGGIPALALLVLVTALLRLTLTALPELLSAVVRDRREVPA